jgi:hypothetical protein
MDRCAPLKGFATALAFVLAPACGAASDFELLSAGVQVQFGETTVLGQDAPDSFQEYDVRAAWRTPWEHQFLADFSVGMRVLGSVGAFRGSGKLGAVASAIPVLALGTADGRFTVDGGLGLAVLSRYRYAQQDYGGPLQFALTFGVEAPVYRRLGAGYRFMHYSDAGSYGPDTVGADLHMAGLTYRF